MEEKVLKKMARYIELSEKFTKSDTEILTDKGILKNNNSTIITGGSNICFGSGSASITFTDFCNGLVIDGKEIYIDDDGNVKAKDPKKPLTRGEQYKAEEMVKAEETATMMDEYDEYLRLRKSLKGYLNSVDELLED